MKRLICTALASLLLVASFSSCDMKINKSDADTNSDIEINDIDDTNISRIDYEKIYSDTINSYIKIITDNMHSPSIYSSVICPPDMDEEIGTALLSLYYNYGSALDGYCIKDINGDGVDELIFIGANYYVQGLCTYVDGKVRFVKEFGHNGNGGAIDKYGNIYDSRCGRFLSWFESIQVLESNGELRDIIYYGHRGTESSDGIGRYKRINGEYISATEEEIEEYYKQYRKYASPGVGNEWKNMTSEHLSTTPFYSLNEINDIVISIFEDTFSEKREVMWECFYGTLGSCNGNKGLISKFNNKIVYTDYNNDGITDAILHSSDNGYFLLKYSFDYNHVDVKLLGDVPTIESNEWIGIDVT